ncbi:MAG: HpaII family restriction endonuclease, partial [Cytophagales bacterium]
MNKEKLTGNKGEWSELYVLFKLLAEAKLYSADENLNRTHNNVDVKSINRVDSVRQLIYEIDDGDGIINIIDGLRNEKIKSLTKTEAINLSTKLVNEIKSGAGRAFSVSKRLKALLNKYEITKVSEKSSSKSDIDIKIYDPKHSLTSQQKFSIKSLLGSQPTLFNANKTTNIIY